MLPVQKLRRLKIKVMCLFIKKKKDTSEEDIKRITYGWMKSFFVLNKFLIEAITLSRTISINESVCIEDSVYRVVDIIHKDEI